MSQIQDRLSRIFLMKKVTIVQAKNPQTSKRISLILFFQGKQQVFPNNISEEETELEDHHHDNYVSYSGFVENFSNPTSVEKVLASPDEENWLKAMDREYKAQIDNGTWELVDLPSDRKPLKSKWVYEMKKDDLLKIWTGCS
ncbi:hypothetical protein JTB14_011028 [Gonioctena quinquepunctata]|nr:hypothetical protein JTB14_011028 [Gonioctena quinquepunctata]